MKSRSIAVLVASVCLGWTTPAKADVVTTWNLIILNCVGGVPPSIPAGRGGPTGVIDIALAQAAVHDAVQAVQGRFEPYKYVNRARLAFRERDVK